MLPSVFPICHQPNHQATARSMCAKPCGCLATDQHCNSGSLKEFRKKPSWSIPFLFFPQRCSYWLVGATSYQRSDNLHTVRSQAQAGPNGTVFRRNGPQVGGGDVLYRKR